MSVIATALRPPDKEYASDNSANKIRPLIKDNPVVESDKPKGMAFLCHFDVDKNICPSQFLVP